MKKISIAVLIVFILSNIAYGAGTESDFRSLKFLTSEVGGLFLRPEMAFGKGDAESHFITHQKDRNGSDVWRVPAWYAEPRVAPELVDLFSAAEKLEISRFKIGGGTARDFCLGVFFGIRTIDKSSDIDVIIPGIEKFDNLWGFLEEFQKIAMGKRGLERFPCIDIVLGWAPPEEKRMVYESLYVEGDLSITKLVIEKEQEFYIITDSYGGVSDIRDKILRFVNMTDAQFSAERVMDRYIPYFAKLKQYGFKYEPASKKRIDDFLQESRFSIADILRGINSVFDKAGNSDAAFAALQEFKLLDILERQTDGLDAQSDSNIVSELRGFIGRVRNRETIDPEALSDFIERLCKAIEGRVGRSGVSDVYRQALLRPEMAFGKKGLAERKTKSISLEQFLTYMKDYPGNALTLGDFLKDFNRDNVGFLAQSSDQQKEMVISFLEYPETGRVAKDFSGNAIRLISVLRAKGILKNWSSDKENTYIIGNLYFNDQILWHRIGWLFKFYHPLTNRPYMLCIDPQRQEPEKAVFWIYAVFPTGMVPVGHAIGRFKQKGLELKGDIPDEIAKVIVFIQGRYQGCYNKTISAGFAAKYETDREKGLYDERYIYHFLDSEFRDYPGNKNVEVKFYRGKSGSPGRILLIAACYKHYTSYSQ